MVRKVALERAYIERNGCPFAIGEDKLPEKLLELKRNVGNHYEDFDLWWWYLFCAMYLQIFTTDRIWTEFIIRDSKFQIIRKLY